MPIRFCIKYYAECFVQDKKILPIDGANHSVVCLLSLGEGTIQSEILFPIVTIAVKKKICKVLFAQELPWKFCLAD